MAPKMRGVKRAPAEPAPLPAPAEQAAVAPSQLPRGKAARQRKTAVAAEESPAAKPAAETEPAAAVEEDPEQCCVIEAIRDSGLPEDCRDMLLALVPGAVAIEERCAFQVLAGGLLTRALEAKRATLREALEREAAALESVEAQRQVLEARAEKLAKDVVAVAEVTEAQKQSLAAASQDMLRAQQTFQAAQQAQKTHDASTLQARERKAALEVAMTKNFVPLKEGDWETGQSKAHIDVLVPLVHTLGVDMSLATALPSSFAKKPEERGPFDQMVIKEVEAQLQEKARQLQREVEDASPQAAERLRAAEAASAELEATRARQHQAAADLSSSQERQLLESSAFEAAKAAIDAHKSEHLAAIAERDARARALEDFEAGPLRALAKLLASEASEAAAPVVAPAAEAPAEERPVLKIEAATHEGPGATPQVALGGQ